jgi:hypothetical protein
MKDEPEVARCLGIHAPPDGCCDRRGIVALGEGSVVLFPRQAVRDRTDLLDIRVYLFAQLC